MNSHKETMDLQPPLTSRMKDSKTATRGKTYLITSPDSISILSTGEEVTKVHREEVESHAPACVSAKMYRHGVISLVSINYEGCGDGEGIDV